jgi:hypothetical protein
MALANGDCTRVVIDTLVSGLDVLVLDELHGIPDNQVILEVLRMMAVGVMTCCMSSPGDPAMSAEDTTFRIVTLVRFPLSSGRS